jgi:hypothetical protein
MGKKIHILSDVDETERTGVCAHCGPVRVSRKGERWTCSVARDQWRRGRYRGPSRHHGLNPRQADEFIEAHGGRCEICKRADRPLFVDHDHGDGRLRGVLCRQCNLGISYFGDDPEVLATAIDYLNRR